LSFGHSAKSGLNDFADRRPIIQHLALVATFSSSEKLGKAAALTSSLHLS
jgi:hypothetical protein